MAALGAIAGLIGTGLQVVGSIQQGRAMKAQAESAALMEEKRGKDELAVYQRKADQERKRGDYARSRAMAVAASSGAGGGETPSVAETIGAIAQQAAENEAAYLSSGKAAREDRFYQASLYRQKGESDYRGSLLEGFARGFTRGFTGLSKVYG